MGCDIHVFFERKKEDGQWEALWPQTPESWYKGYPILHPEETWARPEIRVRHYYWFAKLAGVCDYDDNDRIWEPRGWPDDVTETNKAIYEYWGVDGHTPSWQMVSELINHPHLQDFEQVEWLKKFIEDPENTRMLYFFDN